MLSDTFVKKYTETLNDDLTSISKVIHASMTVKEETTMEEEEQWWWMKTSS